MTPDTKHSPTLDEATLRALENIPGKPPDDLVPLAVNSSRRFDADRWTELQILHSRSTGLYASVIVGRSVVPGETDRYRVEISLSAEVIVESLAPKGDDGRPRLTWTGKKTLLEAALTDDEISYALDAFEETYGD